MARPALSRHPCYSGWATYRLPITAKINMKSKSRLSGLLLAAAIIFIAPCFNAIARSPQARVERAVIENIDWDMTVAVVGDGAVGLLGVLSAKQMGAERIIAMSRHKTRQDLALEFGATDIVTERGDRGVAKIKEMTNGVGADAVLECVGTQKSMMQAIQATRPGGGVGYVGVPHGVELDGEKLFFSHVRLHGGPAPVRQYLPTLIDLVWNKKINPGKVFGLTLPLV